MPRAAWTPEVEAILQAIAEDTASTMANNLGVATDDVFPDIFAALRDAYKATLPYVMAYCEPSHRGPRG